jgi:oligoribonuclease NrnB/cAMP/cGMP phosphodiesterase (DHH superfamily)
MIFPDVPSARHVPPHIAGKNIIIIDVAYKKDILEEIISVAKKVTFIDHHDSIHNDILSMNVKYPHEIIYNERKCGSELTWEYFFGNKPVPKFIDYINDNDIGAWKLSNTLPFITGLEVNYKTDPTKSTIKQWTKLFRTKEVISLIKIGRIYMEYKNHLLEENYKRYSMESFPSKLVCDKFPDDFTKEGQYRVALLNTNCPGASLLGVKVLANIDCDFVIMYTYNMDRKDYVLMFRSKKIDVGSIAKVFGGGGHKLASACSIHSNEFKIDDLFGDASLPRKNL